MWDLRPEINSEKFDPHLDRQLATQYSDVEFFLCSDKTIQIAAGIGLACQNTALSQPLQLRLPVFITLQFVNDNPLQHDDIHRAAKYTDNLTEIFQPEIEISSKQVITDLASNLISECRYFPRPVVGGY